MIYMILLDIKSYHIEGISILFTFQKTPQLLYTNSQLKYWSSLSKTAGLPRWNFVITMKTGKFTLLR